MYNLKDAVDISKFRKRTDKECERNSLRKQNEVILIFGKPFVGENDWNVECFDAETERRYTIARLGIRESSAFALIGEKRVMISGGKINGAVSSFVELFHLCEKVSHPQAPLNVARRYHGSCAVLGVVVVGGGIDEGGYQLRSCEIFCQLQWRQLPEMKEARGGVAIVSAPDGRVFAIGGWNEEGSLSSVEFCRLPADLILPTLAEGFWRSLAPMREARQGLAAIVFHGCILVAGGWNDENLSSVEMLSLDRDRAQWVSLSASMNEKRAYDFSLVIASTKIFAFGDDKVNYNSVERLELTKLDQAVSFSTSVIEHVSAASWKVLSPIASMKRIHAAIPSLLK